MSKEIPDDLVKLSLEKTVAFAKTILPILKVAVDFVRDDIRRVPPGGARHPESEAQLAPTLIRLRFHQLVEGHNQNITRFGGSPLKRKHIRNGAVCLLLDAAEFRLLKSSKVFPTRPSGYYQERLINQTKYKEHLRSGQMSFKDLNGFPISEDRKLLNGLVYYEMKNLELLGAYVVIPDGFIDEKRVNVLDSRKLDVFTDLEELATFENTGVLNIVQDRTSVVVSESILDDLPSDYDPYDDEVNSDEEAVDAAESSESVFDKEETEPEQ